MITDERLKQLMKSVGMPNSNSLMQALRQCDKEARLSEREKCAKFEGVDIDELIKQAKGLCLRINAEGGHGSVVHDMAERVLKIIGDSSRSCAAIPTKGHG